jgi:hypothetical protein
VYSGKGCSFVGFENAEGSVNQIFKSSNVLSFLARRNQPSTAQRRVIYDISTKYFELQRALTTGGTGQHRRFPAISVFSAAVSSILQANSGTDLLQAQERALWDLIAMFTFDSCHVAKVDLAKWVHDNPAAIAGSLAAAPLPSTLAAQLQDSAMPEAHPEYWRALQRLVSLGWITEALDVIGLHSAWFQWGERTSAGDNAIASLQDTQIAVLEAVTLLLRRFPTLTGYGAAGDSTARAFDSLAELLSYRLSWQGQCVTLLNNEDLWERCRKTAPDTAEGLRKVVAMLTGQDREFVAGTWSELLVAHLLHVHPGLQNLAELRQLLHKCCAELEPVGDFQVVVAAVMDACCDSDMQSAIRACSEWAAPWFMAYIQTLFVSHPAAGAQLNRELPHLGATQMEWFELEFASCLAPHSATMLLAAEQLSWCPNYGARAFEQIVKRLPVYAADMRACLQIVRMCDEHGMLNLVTHICRLHGVSFWQSGLHSAALTWFLKADDRERCDIALSSLACMAAGERQAYSSDMMCLLSETLDAVPTVSVGKIAWKLRLLLASPEPEGSLQGSFESVVRMLDHLPKYARSELLNELWPLLPRLDGKCVLNEHVVLSLLEWLEADIAKGLVSSTHASVARLSLVRLLACHHIATFKRNRQLQIST